MEEHLPSVDEVLSSILNKEQNKHTKKNNKSGDQQKGSDTEVWIHLRTQKLHCWELYTVLTTYEVTG